MNAEVWDDPYDPIVMTRVQRQLDRETLPCTDLGNARRLIDRHGDDVRYVPQFKQWIVWNGKAWREDLTGDVDRKAKQVVDALPEETKQHEYGSEQRKELSKHWAKSQHVARLAAMVELARTEPGIPITPDRLDADPWVLNVANGMFDLHTGRLMPHDRAQLCTRIVDITYDPNARAPLWEKFLHEVFAPHPALVGFIKRWAGYCLTGQTTEQALVFAHGTGANGKSVLISTLRSLLGPYAITLDPKVLTKTAYDQHPTALTDLRGARFAATVETENGGRLAESLVKQLTGGDAISARRMRGDYYEFNPTHKLVVAGNHLPRIDGTDHAIWRRILLVPFDVTFDGERCDPQLPERLQLELPGILRWAVEGCLEWQDGGLEVPAIVKAKTDAYRAAEDHVGRFLADCTTSNEHNETAASVLRDTYERWCHEQGEKPRTAQALGKELTSRGYDSHKTGRANTKHWIGLELVDRGPYGPSPV